MPSMVVDNTFNGVVAPSESSIINVAKSSSKNSIPDVRIIAFNAGRKRDHDGEIITQSCKFDFKPVTQHSKLPGGALICTRIPPTDDHHGTAECMLYARTIADLNSIFEFNKRPPLSLKGQPVAYETHWDEESKRWHVTATRDLVIGELILVERPLFVLPTNANIKNIEHPEVLCDVWYNVPKTPMNILEPMLDFLVHRTLDTKTSDALFANNNDGNMECSAYWRSNCLRRPGILGENYDDSNKNFRPTIFKVLLEMNKAIRSEEYIKRPRSALNMYNSVTSLLERMEHEGMDGDILYLHANRIAEEVTSSLKWTRRIEERSNWSTVVDFFRDKVSVLARAHEECFTATSFEQDDTDESDEDMESDVLVDDLALIDELDEADMIDIAMDSDVTFEFDDELTDEV
ncbi:hypothetical protein BDQ17DRAFT_1437191 [Cyathus striatus]|nr:hypothetical protein BDQ17DRAFT_1437191 [Cyathus striatus]